MNASLFEEPSADEKLYAERITADLGGASETEPQTGGYGKLSRRDSTIELDRARDVKDAAESAIKS